MDQYLFAQKFLDAKNRGLSDDAAAAEAMQGETLLGTPMQAQQAPIPQEPQTPAGQLFEPLVQQYEGARRMVRETAGPQVNPYTGVGMPQRQMPQMPEPPNLIGGVDVSRLEGLRSKIDTAAEQAASHGYEEREEALRKISEIDAQRAAIQAEAREQALGEYNKMISEQTEREQRISGQLEEKLAAHSQAVADYMNTKVDPNNYWANASTGAKIMAALGVVLGAMGSKATGGRNVALDIINNAIDRDMEAQKIQLDKMGRRASMMENEYAMARNHFSDTISQDLAARKTLLEKAQMQIETELSKTDQARARAAGQDLLGQLELQKADLENKLKERELSNAFRLESSIIDAKRANVALHNQAEMAKYQARAARAAAEMKAGEAKQSPVPGVTFLTDKPSRQQIAAAFNVSQGFKSFQDAVGELRGLREEVKKEMEKRGPAAVMYGKDRYEEIADKIKSAYKAVTGTDMKIDISPGLSSYANEKKLKAALIIAEKEARKKLRNLGADLDLPETNE